LEKDRYLSVIKKDGVSRVAEIEKEALSIRRSRAGTELVMWQ
jgi:hypothetical protein